jgi:hypothetical protein
MLQIATVIAYQYILFKMAFAILGNGHTTGFLSTLVAKHSVVIWAIAVVHVGQIKDLAILQIRVHVVWERRAWRCHDTIAGTVGILLLAIIRNVKVVHAVAETDG